jgi:hypothetical protein
MPVDRRAAVGRRSPSPPALRGARERLAGGHLRAGEHVNERPSVADSLGSMLAGLALGRRRTSGGRVGTGDSRPTSCGWSRAPSPPAPGHGRRATARRQALRRRTRERLPDSMLAGHVPAGDGRAVAGRSKGTAGRRPCSSWSTAPSPLAPRQDAERVAAGMRRAGFYVNAFLARCWWARQRRAMDERWLVETGDSRAMAKLQLVMSRTSRRRGGKTRAVSRRQTAVPGEHVNEQVSSAPLDVGGTRQRRWLG